MLSSKIPFLSKFDLGIPGIPWSEHNFDRNFPQFSAIFFGPSDRNPPPAGVAALTGALLVIPPDHHCTLTTLWWCVVHPGSLGVERCSANGRKMDAKLAAKTRKKAKNWDTKSDDHEWHLVKNSWRQSLAENWGGPTPLYPL